MVSLPGHFRLLKPATWIALAICVVGCAQQDGNLESLSMANHKKGSQVLLGPAQYTPEQLQSEVMSFADTYVSLATQSLDDLKNRTTRPEVADWALENKLAAALAVYTNATGPNEVTNLLDMLVFVDLKRSAVENHWIPVLLHDEGQGVLAAARKGDALAWEMAARALTPDQVDEMHKLIDQWRADNPDQYYLTHIRFSEFAAARQITRNSPQAKQPSNLFSLLYLDPMANLDPVAQEMQSYRELAERLIFLMERTPLVIGWETELVSRRAIAAPQIKDFVNNTAKLADAAAQFADASAKYPQDLSAERRAAVAQIADEVTKQREAFDQDLDRQSGRLGKLVTQADDLVAQLDKAGASINAATTATVLTGEQASRRTLNHAFELGMALILVMLIGIPTAILTYRWTSRKYGFALPTPNNSPPQN
jgi:hypothetical protein